MDTGSRDAVLAHYRAVRAGIRDILRAAPEACALSDLRRAAKHVMPWADSNEDLELDDALDMVADVAIFEPNQRGRRVYDKFLATTATQFDAGQLAQAKRMGDAWFSLFRFGPPHDTFGIWLDDLLDGERRIWLADESLETTAQEGMVVGMRIFDADPFHAGFGIVTMPGEDTIAFCLSAKADGPRLPFRYSLAATLYADKLLDQLPDEPVSFDTIVDELTKLRIFEPPKGSRKRG